MISNEKCVVPANGLVNNDPPPPKGFASWDDFVESIGDILEAYVDEEWDYIVHIKKTIHVEDDPPPKPFASWDAFEKSYGEHMDNDYDE